MDQALQGKIGKFTIPEIFQFIAGGSKTGTLGIQSDDNIVMVYFSKGRITYAYGPRQSGHIGQILNDAGRISADQLEDAVSYQSGCEVTKRLGQILVEKGYVTQDELNKAIKRQVEELIYSLLLWETGSFKFYENQYPTNEEITIDLSVENVILEGLRRMDEINRFREALPDYDIPLKICETASEQGKDISLTPEEWNLLAIIDGRHNIRQLIDTTRQPEIEVLERLAALKLAGLITVTDKKEAESGHLTEMINRVSGLLEDYLAHRTERATRNRIDVEVTGDNH